MGLDKKLEPNRQGDAILVPVIDDPEQVAECLRDTGYGGERGIERLLHDLLQSKRFIWGVLDEEVNTNSKRRDNEPD
jgi:hypothetical protein